jgi:hypothetical protein
MVLSLQAIGHAHKSLTMLNILQDKFSRSMSDPWKLQKFSTSEILGYTVLCLFALLNSSYVYRNEHVWHGMGRDITNSPWLFGGWVGCPFTPLNKTPGGVKLTVSSQEGPLQNPPPPPSIFLLWSKVYLNMRTHPYVLHAQNTYTCGIVNKWEWLRLLSMNNSFL